MEDKILTLHEIKIQKLIEKIRPPLAIRHQLDITYTYNNQSFEIFESRPGWDNPNVITNLPFAKLKYIQSKKSWKLYWMRASGKWELYEPIPESPYLEKLLQAIDEDKHGCFKG